MSRFNRSAPVLLGVLLAFCLASSAEAVLIRVSQELETGSGDFDDNILGFVDPFNAGGLSTSAFYQYGNPNGASYNGELNGGPNPVSSLSQIFMVSASDGLSLVVVHDNPNDGSGGNTQTHWELLGDVAAQVLADDPGEPVTVSGGGTVFDSTKRWFDCCTDGYAIGSLEGDWAMFGHFVGTPTGITRWIVVDDSGSQIPLELEPGRRVRLDTVPEPATWLLVGFGLAGLVARRRCV